MVDRCVSAKLVLVLFIACFSSVAAAQTKPRFVIAIDTSGSMRENFSGTNTSGDGVGRLPIGGDSAALTKNGVYYGCASPQTGSGSDTPAGDGLPNDSKIWQAKDAVTKMIYGFGDVEWALSRFKQTQASNASQPNNTCAGQGTSSGTYFINYAGESQATCQAAGTHAEMVLGFPHVTGQAFAGADNRSALLRWLDNVETGFHAPIAADLTAVDLCAHAGGNDCELRIPSNAFTPLGSIISVSGAYAKTTRAADSAAACRRYSVLLLTDGAETCNSNPNQAAFTLAYPGQTFPASPANLPNVTPDIRTYVVGVSIQAADVTSLNNIAAYGGTTQAYFANSPTALAAALSDIVNGSIAFETCNGLDDDCDTKIDEDLPFGQPGAAAQPSALFCDGEGHRTVAQNTQVRVRPDYADNLPQTTAVTQPVVCGRVTDTCQHAGFDDDCDGKMDEDGALTACGTCPGAPDICDGLDNDCDGKFDEGVNSGIPFSACPTACTADVPCGSNVGECRPGVYKCLNGTLGTTCTGQTLPTAEICDEKDNNCNGIIDDPTTLARACTTPYGNVGICQPGTQFCAKPSIGELKNAQGYHVDQSGAPVCEGQVLPEDRELCDALDHDCDGNNFTCTQPFCNPSPLPAFVGNSCGIGLGVCVGTLQCNTTAMPPALVCNAPTGSTEICNNIDDDCDGSIDDNAVAGPDLGNVMGGAANAFCGTETRTAGVCNPGHFLCLNGHWSCRDEIGAAAEICNGVDDDCDTRTDEAADVMANDPRIGQQCGTSVGECDPGFSTCTAQGTVVCTPVKGPVDETCNGKDDDCDNLTDEQLPDTNPKDGVRDLVACGSDVGLCDPGQLSCVAVATNVDPDGFDYVCVGGVSAAPEICDGKDNDCDGDTDECAGAKGSPAYNACKNDPFGDLGAGGGDTCGTTVPPCTPGKTQCVADADGMGNPGFICAGAFNGMPEICNNMDDDCDQKVDEDLDPINDPRLGMRCGDSVVGACRVDVDNDQVPNDPDDQPCGQCRFGLQQCVLGAIDCIGDVGPAMYELCNATDDDCDGNTDECVDPNDASCAAGTVDPNTPVGSKCGDATGECKQGTNACEGGVLNCKDYVGPTPEVCNGDDDDCDGNTDENIPTGAPCGSSVGECQPGVLVCPAGGSGALVCKGGAGPEDETCDGLDNDCDGSTDEGLGLGKACGTDEGLCSKGKLTCLDGKTVCSGEKGPQTETCDCQDNDCDGKIDEVDDKTMPICPGTAACVMCQCALPCAESNEFGAECPQGKAAIQNPDGCFCVGALCDQIDCQKKTISVNDQVQCAPDSTRVGACLCSNNECTFRCAGVECEGDLVCDPTDGRCKMKSCLLPQFMCDKDQRCQITGNQWECVDDPCALAQCAADQACRDGKCLGSCADVTCDKGKLCSDGACVADRCSGVSCDSGKVCNPDNGKCVAAGACVGNGCGDGQLCDAVSGDCGEDPCLATHCPQGEQCNSQTGQCENRCFGNLLFCGDACINPLTSHAYCGATADCAGNNAGDACTGAMACSRGKCSESCDQSLVNCGGDCVDPQSDALHCGAKSDCKDKNDGAVCGAGTKCMEGKCQTTTMSIAGDPTTSTKPDGTRVIASGGGGCTCSVPGAAQSGGAPAGRRGLFGMLLLALCSALLARRRPRVLLIGSRLLLLALGSVVLLGSGCKVDTFCLDCPSADDTKPNKNGNGNSIAGGRADASIASGNAGNGGTGGTGSGGTSNMAGDGSVPTGDGGTCKPSTEVCNGLDDDCDGKIDEDADPAAVNIDLKTDPNNCGKCGAVCGLQHAFNLCKDGACGIDHKQGDDGCDVGYHDLDGKDEDGCEYHCTKTADDDSACDLVDNDCDNKIDEDVDFASDPDNCGACSFRCSRPHAAKGVKCVDQKCVLDDTKCDKGFANIDTKDANGCEYRCPVFPTVDELCNGLDDDCDGVTDDHAEDADSRIGVVCGSTKGECRAGRMTCESGAPTCTGTVIGPQQEVCDGLDNDCDDEVDTDDPSLGLPCGEAAPGSQCSKGTLQIPPGGCMNGVVQELACLGGRGPVDEVCNGLDDDCDGKADEAESGIKPEEGQKCTNGSNGFALVSADPPGLCRAGNTSCESGNLVCRNEVAPELNERCDNLDHDCDGDVLNGFAPDVPNGTTATSGPDSRVGKNCGVDTGECAFGVQTCHLDTKVLSCDNQVLPAIEICDGKDNDCDGKIDEHTKDSGNLDIPLAGEGVDCITNANGTVNSNPPSSASRGECDTGTTVCAAGKIGCQGQIGPRPELCDAEDWDCDGNANNGVTVTDPAVAKPCGPPNVGACRGGTTTCTNNTVVCNGAFPSSTYVPPAQTNTPELMSADPLANPNPCNGIDDDCDGAADEGAPAAYNGATCCDIVGFSCCTQGTRQCNNGHIQCVYPVGAKLPKTEVCGGGDDDCDTRIDEGFDIHTDVNNCGSCGHKCAFNAGVTNGHAVLVCAADTCKIGACEVGFVDGNSDYRDGCERACTFTGNEICDNVDNDCNGVVDDLATIPSQVCLAKKTGVCDVPELLTQGPSCINGVLGCNIQALVTAGKISNYQAVETLCDSKDNDCNGKVDEMIPQVGKACTKGQGACQTTGINVCDSNAPLGAGYSCNAATPSGGSAEICDNVDNDCNGTVDDFTTPNTTHLVTNVDFVDLGVTTGHTLVMAYEASRPGATSDDAGRQTQKACSLDSVLPWANVTWPEASAACCSLNTGGACDGAGLGWRLCDSSTWDYTCRGPGSTCNWGYSNTAGAVCAHDPRVSTYRDVCMGAEALVDAVATCAVGNTECAANTGSSLFPQCRTVWPAGSVWDLSGNTQEWTNTAQGTNIYEIRGGSYNDVENGRTCDFNFAVGNTTFRFPNTGFRCCYYPAPPCATYDAGVLALAAAADSGNLDSTLTVPATTGTITSVQLLDVTGTDPNRFGDLTFSLTSPTNTPVNGVNVINSGNCGSDANWAFDLRDDATNIVQNADPFCAGTTLVGGGVANAYKPQNAFTAFNGQAPAGSWRLRINDNTDRGAVNSGDKPTLTGWKLRICTNAYAIP